MSRNLLTALGLKRPVFLFLVLFIAVSCAPKQAARPVREGVALEELISSLKNIQALETVMTLEYEKGESIMSGEAFMNLSAKELNLRVYYLGFLAGEVKEKEGVIETNPKLDRNKKILLTDGLRSSFFWWNIAEYTLENEDDRYILRNDFRKVVIDKKMLLPLIQVIEMPDGEKLTVYYDSPVVQPEPALWYQSSLRIEYRQSIVKAKIKSFLPLR
ncbi:MAG: hypothetical protein HQL10_00740 [Nitrospirae bacterium]|nr:hypothetical protein [Nitrospirota bacterium]